MIFKNVAFAEQIVKRKKTKKHTAICVGVVAGVIIVFFIISIVMAVYFFEEYGAWTNAIASVLLAVACLFVFYFFKYTKVEFEYSLIDGQMDISKIMGRERRKSIISFTTENVSVLGPCSEENAPKYSGSFQKTYDCTSAPDAEGRWFIVLTKGSGMNALIFIEPNEKMIDALKQSLKKDKFAQ